MDLYQSATHILTNRVDLYHRSVMREFKNFERDAAEEEELFNYMAERFPDKFPYNRPYDPMRDRTPDYIIEYPHAASRFWKLGGNPDYLVAVISKKRKCPVVDVQYWMDYLRLPVSLQTHGIELTWGVDGERICKIAITRERGKITEHNVFGLDEFQSRLSYLVPRPNFWEELLKDPYPTEIAEKASEALGMFVCGREYDKFLAEKCVLTHSFICGNIYKAMV